jgi:hypothetical protein
MAAILMPNFKILGEFKNYLWFHMISVLFQEQEICSNMKIIHDLNKMCSILTRKALMSNR